MRCRTCGRNSKPVPQCYACLWKEAEDSADDPPEIPRSCVLVWSADRRAIEALIAQWPGHHEVLMPDFEGDHWGVRLALHRDGLGANPVEYEVRDGRLERVPGLAEQVKADDLARWVREWREAELFGTAE